ncbi:hypothetical protein M422DRAFT_131814, partial [Sphaerobolus stellatus SS14]
LRQSGAVISGSTALNLIMGVGSWSSKDMDVYIRKSEARAVVAFLAREGYTCVWPRYHNPDSHIHCIMKFEKINWDGTTLTVDVIESNSSSAIAPITEFHCTALMNYISGDGILCLYPRLTEE